MIVSLGANILAQVQTFEQAKALSATSGKPVLLEFVHKGCEYCEMAAEQQENSETIKAILKKVVHIIFDVNEGEGIELSENYNVGIYYPVFVLTNSKGEVIYQWFGYNKDEKSFIHMLNTAMADLTTIKDRIATQSKSPTVRNATFLAKYYADTGNNLKAVDYYRQAQEINPRLNYRMQIFKNMAEAAWDDKIAFDAVLPVADSVLNYKKSVPYNSVEVAKLVTRLARMKNETYQIEKYLRTGIDAAKSDTSQKMVNAKNDLRADFTLHIDGDTAKAISMKKTAMGQGWENNRDVFYNFSKWCLERKINLEEAEIYARKAVNMVYPGKYRARVLKTVAEICDARGKTDEAIKIINLAIDEEPDNDLYVNLLEEYLAKSRRQKK